jgi:hypothetical protein
MALSGDIANAFFYEGRLSSDTLIIDSDTIYIEQDEVASTQDTLHRPPGSNKSVRKHLWCASLAAGVNVTSVSVNSNLNGSRLLNDFVGLAMLPQVNLSMGGEFGMRFLTLKGNRGNIELTASIAFSMNKIKIRYSSVKNPSQLQQDSIIQFSSQSNELLLYYFKTTGSPGIGEVDTLPPIALSSPQLVYNTRDVLATLRATYSRGSNHPRYYFETGVAKRFVKFSKSGDPFYLLNEDGRWTTIGSEKLPGRNVLVPHFAIGFEKNISGDFSSSKRFVTIGASLSASFPSVTFITNETISIELRNAGVLIFARSFF